MEYHKAASIFPLDEEHISELAKDIKENGLQVPIELLNGKIIDGRRRWLACKKAKVEPDFCDVEVPDPIQYVWSLNYHRRHLTISQRSMCSARAENLRLKAVEDAKERQGERTDLTLRPGGLKVKSRQARDDVGKAYGISGRSVERGQRVLDKGVPEIEKAVDKGKLSITQADEIVREPKERQPTLLRQALKPEAKPVKVKKVEEEQFDGKLRGKGIVLANEAVNCLMRIPKSDPFRGRGFQIVTDWIRSNR